MGFLEKVFGNYSQKEIKRLQPTVNKVLALENEFAAMSDAQLRGMTDKLKARLANGETLDDILPEAFATCREASWRVLEMKHFPVQILGSLVLHQGRIAEMKTGEGKTLVATLACYLNALAGKGVHVVTVNDCNNFFPEIGDDICRIFERTYFFDCFVVEILWDVIFFDVIQVFQILDPFA